MIALLTAALLAGLPPRCSPPEGTAALLDRPEQVVVVGEIHGTVEGPAAFAGVVCAAAERGPVTVGLEMTESDQTLLDAVMMAPDEPTATRILRSGDFGDPRKNDGKHSGAMFQMVIDLWKLRAAGRDVAIRAFLPRMSVIQSRDQAWRELEMAYGMSRAFVARPHARLFVLAGNLHARKLRIDDIPQMGVPAAGLLPAPDTLTLNMASQGGASWNCRPDCGPHSGAAVDSPEVRGVILGPVMDGAYDGVLAVGPTSPSSPAAGQR